MHFLYRYMHKMWPSFGNRQWTNLCLYCVLLVVLHTSCPCVHHSSVLVHLNFPALFEVSIMYNLLPKSAFPSSTQGSCVSEQANFQVGHYSLFCCATSKFPSSTQGSCVSEQANFQVGHYSLYCCATSKLFGFRAAHNTILSLLTSHPPIFLTKPTKNWMLDL